MTNQLDKYYTKPHVADYCIDVLLRHTADCDTFIEPSAGSGAFIKNFTTHSFDLEPECDGVIKADWLSVDPSMFIKSCVYGNPPFGKKNKLTKRFIEKACSFADVVGFILPAVFNKHTLQKTFPSDWSLVESIQLSNDSFTEYGEDYNIPSVFQVWKRGICDINLRKVGRTDFTNKHFSIVNKENGDIFVMGAAPHTVKFPEIVIANNRGYWLQCHIQTETVINNFMSIKWSGHSCASGGVAWHTKSEIMETYEENYNESK